MSTELACINQAVALRCPFTTPALHRSEDGLIEHSVNDPIAYARQFDLLTSSVDTIKSLLGKYNHIPALLHATLSKDKTATESRGAFMITFDGYEALCKRRPTVNRLGCTFVWMPETKLFPSFERFRWTLQCYTPGKSMLFFLNSNLEDRDRDSWYGRVCVVTETECLPLTVGCPVCLQPSDKWCARCKWVSYCCVDDQRAHYADHKKACVHYKDVTCCTRHPILDVPVSDREWTSI